MNVLDCRYYGAKRFQYEPPPDFVAEKARYTYTYQRFLLN